MTQEIDTKIERVRWASGQKDYDAVHMIEQAYFGRPLPRSRKNDDFCRVAVNKGGQILGVIRYRHGPRRELFRRICVDCTLQRRGIGSQILQHFVTRQLPPCPEGPQKRRVRLRVELHNPDSSLIKFFHKNGFEVVSQRQYGKHNQLVQIAMALVRDI